MVYPWAVFTGISTELRSKASFDCPSRRQPSVRVIQLSAGRRYPNFSAIAVGENQRHRWVDGVAVEYLLAVANRLAVQELGLVLVSVSVGEWASDFFDSFRPVAEYNDYTLFHLPN